MSPLIFPVFRWVQHHPSQADPAEEGPADCSGVWCPCLYTVQRPFHQITVGSDDAAGEALWLYVHQLWEASSRQNVSSAGLVEDDKHIDRRSSHLQCQSKVWTRLLLHYFLILQKKLWIDSEDINDQDICNYAAKTYTLNTSKYAFFYERGLF